MHAIVTCLKEWQAELKSVSKPFKIITDHKNLSFFATKRLLSERQVRYNDVLQQFNFNLEWRSGKTCERPDALSRRDQDHPLGITDERTAGRVLQLLPPISLSPANIQNRNSTSEEKVDSAANMKLFEDNEVQSLWAQGVIADEDWRQARDCVKAGERGLPPDIVQKF